MQHFVVGKADTTDLENCLKKNQFKSANKLIQISFLRVKCINNASIATEGWPGPLSNSEANRDYMLRGHWL